jgi:hypothetical protein
MGQSVGSVDSSFFLGRYGRRSVQNADTGIRRMERGVSLPSSNPLGGSNFRESRPIGIKSYPALALLSPGSGYAYFLLQHCNPFSKGLQRKFYNILLRLETGIILEDDHLFACLLYDDF